MCGIAGIFNRNKQPVDFRILKSMSDTQRHRGPDDQSFVGFSFADESLVRIQEGETDREEISCHGGVGFNRLSILDLSLNARQPMVSPDRRVALAYNGETYNAFEFRACLEKKGHVFRSGSDTEILLYLYQEQGIEKLLELINGMFAFCIVDLALGKLFLARDHAGIKPLYWYDGGNTILFASEIKAFYRHPVFVPELNPENIDEYTLAGYTAHDRTLFKAVYQVPPAHFMEFSMDGRKLERYWEPDLSIKKLSDRSAPASALESVLQKAVKSQLRSDVRVGCQLSGGIDSSLVATFASSHFSRSMDTFSVIPENRGFSEEDYIEQVIEKTRSETHKVEITPRYWAENMGAATYHFDAPVSFVHTLAIKRLAEEASGCVKVLLSGEGADEVMAGYPEFYRQAFRQRHSAGILLGSKIPMFGRKTQRYFLPRLSARDFFIHIRSGNQKYGPSVKADINQAAFFARHGDLFPAGGDALKNNRVYDMRGRLVHLLAMQDRMTMAHAIENRVPFLDRNVIDFVFSKPSDLFLGIGSDPRTAESSNRFTKMLLKRVALNYYSEDFVYRKKIGFSQPLHDYMVFPQMKEMIHDLILPGIRRRGIFNHDFLFTSYKRMVEEPHGRNQHWLWFIFAFEIWAQMFLDNKIGFGKCRN